MTLKQFSILLARISLFVIYFWFGLLKVIGQSPASGMVTELFEKTLGPMLAFVHMSFLSPEVFLVIFGIIEMLIGILILIPGKEKIAIVIFFAHMLTTSLPLFFLKASVWVHPFVPTLEGQYIVKNLALISCVIAIWEISPSRQRKEDSPVIQ